MSWCPICKKDYEDTELCPHCEVSLISGYEEDYSEIFSNLNEEITVDIYNNLIENGFTSAHYYLDENDRYYHVLCYKDDNMSAKQQIIQYVNGDFPIYLTENEQDILNETIDSLADDVKSEMSSSTSQYVSAEDKFTNVRSSATSLLTVGIIGFVILLLDIVGVYTFPFSGTSRWLFMITMSFMFVVFIVSGTISFINSKKLKKQIDVEDNFKEDIEKYILEELDLTPADAKFTVDTSLEEKCLFRSGYICIKVLEKFPNADKLFVEHFVGEIYDSIYPDDCFFDEELIEVLPEESDQ